MGRRKKRKRLGTPPGAPPGALTPNPESPPPVIRAIAYGPDGLVRENITQVDRLSELRRKWPMLWVNVDGTGAVDAIARIGEIFHLHPLALEDAVNIHQRPKVEQYEGHLFIVARMAHLNDQVESEQLSLFLGQGFVISFQEGRPGDPFDPVRDRLEHRVGPLRTAGADYLAYALLDAVIDGYFPLLEAVGERLEVLEDELLACPGPDTMARIHEIRRELLGLRRAAWPLREALNSLVRDVNAFVSAEVRVHLRDCYDHVVRILDFVETDRELSSALMELYLTSVSQRTNEVMRVLTIIATIFIPLTFISGLYGMNFDPDVSPWNMPELEWYWGYPFALTLMVITAGALLVYFRAKGWLGSPVSSRRTVRRSPQQDECRRS